MRRRLHLSNAAGRDATVLFASVRAEAGPALGLANEQVEFRRWLAATDAGLQSALQERYGDELDELESEFFSLTELFRYSGHRPFFKATIDKTPSFLRL